MQNRTIPSVQDIKTILFDEYACIQWLFEQRILERQTVCGNCGGTLVMTGKIIFKCTKNSCRKAKSIIYAGTFFAKSRLTCKVMHLCYLWLSKCCADSYRSFKRYNHCVHKLFPTTYSINT